VPGAAAARALLAAGAAMTGEHRRRGRRGEHRLAGAVLLGRDRAAIAAAIARHAPDLPVIGTTSTDHGAMLEVVRAAAGLAGPGDTVLLAPAGASWDIFANCGAHGDAFAAALPGPP
jgi:UDP-N-acetylmuramoylalanine--D-glutamate ligase